MAATTTQQFPSLPSSHVTIAAAAPRRLPPPCWTHDETTALIDAYRDTWYSLRRGNLRQHHWLDVAAAVSARCPAVSPPKTPVQCRHKMEKLRKRYRSEIQRAAPHGGVRSRRFSSAWVHFKHMHHMELGEQLEDDEEEEEEEEAPADDVAAHDPPYPYPYPKLIGNPYGYDASVNNNGSGGVRIRIPGPPYDSGVHNPYNSSNFGANKKMFHDSGVENSYNFRANKKNFPLDSGVENSYNSGNYGAKKKMFHDSGVENSYNFGNFGSGKKNFSDGFVHRPDSGKQRVEKRKDKDDDAMGEMVAAIRLLGDGFVRMERMKMEMARELEGMRMEMEMKRTQMILESQQSIVEAFAHAFSEKQHKKAKRMPTPEC